MQRRGFLLAAGAGVLARAASPVLDTHIHLYDPSRPEGVPWPPRTDKALYRAVLPTDYEALVKPLGVAGAIVIEASAWLEDNQWLLDITRDRPLFRGIIGHLEPGTPEFRIHLARFSKDPRFRGIRLNGEAITRGAVQTQFADDLRRLAGSDLTLDVIGSAAMLPALTSLADRVPGLRIAIDHMPLEPPGWTPDGIRDLASHPNVYAKVSGVLRREGSPVSYEGVRALFGANRLLYGSNWPVSDRVAPYAAVLAAVPDADRFTANAVTCYGLV